MKLPEFTYTIFAQWPDGEIYTQECRVEGDDREGVFDAAADMVLGHNCEVRIECTERSADGLPIGVTDATAIFYAERIPEDECEYCHSTACTCDDAYDAWRADQEAAA